MSGKPGQEGKAGSESIKRTSGEPSKKKTAGQAEVTTPASEPSNSRKTGGQVNFPNPASEPSKSRKIAGEGEVTNPVSEPIKYKKTAAEIDATRGSNRERSKSRKSAVQEDSNKSSDGTDYSSKSRSKRRSNDVTATTGNPATMEPRQDPPPTNQVPGPMMLLPKRSRVTETIILDHSPSLDLEVEVDRLVSIAKGQCDKEKNDIKRRYEDELRNLRGRLEDENRKVKNNCDEHLAATKTKATEDTRTSMERDVVQPLRDSLLRYEKEAQSLRMSSEEAENALKANRRVADDLQNQNRSLQDELYRLGVVGAENERLQAEIQRLKLVEQENQKLKQRYSEGKAENDETRRKLQNLQEVEKYNATLKEELEAMRNVEEENKRLKASIIRTKGEIQMLEDQLSVGAAINSNLKLEIDKATGAAGNCEQEILRLTELTAKLNTCEAQNSQLREQLDKSGPSSASAGVQTMHPSDFNSSHFLSAGVQTLYPPEPVIQPQKVCSKCSKNAFQTAYPPQGFSNDDRDSMREKIRLLERRVEELVQYLDSIHQGGSRGPPMRPPPPPLPPRSNDPPYRPPAPAPAQNMNAVLDRLEKLEKTLGGFNQRYDSQMGQLQSNMRQQDTQYRSVLGEFSTEITAIKNLVRNTGGPQTGYNDDEGCCHDD